MLIELMIHLFIGAYKNHNTNEFRQLYVDNGFMNLIKINYCFMDEEEYEDAFSSLFDDNWAENHNIIF